MKTFYISINLFFINNTFKKVILFYLDFPIFPLKEQSALLVLCLISGSCLFSG